MPRIQVEGAYEDWIEVLRLVYYSGRSGQPSASFPALNGSYSVCNFHVSHN